MTEFRCLVPRSQYFAAVNCHVVWDTLPLLTAMAWEKAVQELGKEFRLFYGDITSLISKTGIMDESEVFVCLFENELGKWTMAAFK